MYDTRPIVTVRSAAWSALLASAIALAGCALRPDIRDSDLSRARSGGYVGGETVAVLLPKSGRFAGAAQSVRGGILAAQRADKQARQPKLRFYDSSDPKTAPALVRKAAAEGATLVIGPLQREAVEQLAKQSALPLPTLALNRSKSGKTPKNLYQFSLAPEDEAREVAEEAWAKGYRSALLLYPEGSWGSRIERGFRQRWASLGGRVAGRSLYDREASDFSKPVKKLLGKRGDAANKQGKAAGDFIFLVATSNSIRKIWPQIRTQAGRDLPVLSTSHIYSGQFDRQKDRELVGLHFVDIPWLIAPEADDPVSRRTLKKKLPDYPRLYAMGIDAYRLGTRLEWMASQPKATVQGKTGLLRLDSRRHIRRELDLVRLDGSGPVKLAAGTRPDAELFTRIGARDGLAPILAAVGLDGAGGNRR